MLAHYTEELVKLSVSSLFESVSSSIEVIPSVPSSEPQRDAKLPKATTLEMLRMSCHYRTKHDDL